MNTKKLTSISLFIFGVLVTAILVAGLVFYQNNKDIKTSNNKKSVINNTASTSNITNKKNITSNTKNTNSPTSITLNMTEIAKHNKQSNCWMLINDKVYDITPYFGSHPGGNGTMTATCGTDATDAYMTKDPYASSSGSRSAHSSRAQSLLTNYYIGNFNQMISN